MTKTETIINDIYDAWRAQDLDWLASYLPDDFSHMIYIPTEVHPLGGLCNGKAAALGRLALIAVQFDCLHFVQFDCLHFDTSDLMIRKDRSGLEIPFATATERRACSSRRRW
jgi:ketosteroid isomerase-like protein